jgi:hypothetical protein
MALLPIGGRPVLAATVPGYSHVVVIVLENHSYGEIIGSAAAPYINSLLGPGALATNYTAVAHPSVPNYLALTGGSTFGVSSDCTTCWINAPNLGDSLEAAGKTWKTYLESMPSPCYVGDSYPYAQKHNPFVYYNDIRTNASRCSAHDVPYSQLATDLQSASTTPNFAFITPNMCDDMHDCSVATGDSWLSQQVPRILGSPAFTTQRSLLALTWDEDDFTSTNRVPLILLGTGVAGGTASSAPYNHYSLLHTIEAALGAAPVSGNDAAAPTTSTLFNPFYVAPQPDMGQFVGDGRAGIAWVDGEQTQVSASSGTAFSAATQWAATPFYGSRATAGGDVTGDGRSDLIAVDGSATWVMPSTGSSFAAPQQWSSRPFYGTRTTMIADVNGDGKADLIAVNDSSVWVMLSTGAAFGPPVQWANGPFYGNASTLAGDVNGDGRADLIAINHDSTWVMISSGTNMTAPKQWSAKPFFGSHATLAAAVAGTGRADLIAVDDGSVWVMTSSGSSFAAPAQWSSTPFYGSRASLAGDINRDGRSDLIAVGDGVVWVELSTGSGLSAPVLWLSGSP